MGADLKTIQHRHHRLSPPRVLGREIAGEVVSAGAEVTGWAPGTAQVIAAVPVRGLPGVPGRPRDGVHQPGEHGLPEHDGGFAEFMLVLAKAIAVGGLNRIPDGTGPAEASLAELIRRGRAGSARPARG
jgi:L-iditol 2-dehydrogenase